jgi:hypothetical protein
VLVLESVLESVLVLAWVSAPVLVLATVLVLALASERVSVSASGLVAPRSVGPWRVGR